jgi:hypothetical protein
MIRTTLLAIRSTLRSACVSNGRAGGYIAIAIAVLVALMTAQNSADQSSRATTDPGPDDTVPSMQEAAPHGELDR